MPRHCFGPPQLRPRARAKTGTTTQVYRCLAQARMGLGCAGTLCATCIPLALQDVSGGVPTGVRCAGVPSSRTPRRTFPLHLTPLLGTAIIRALIRCLRAIARHPIVTLSLPHSHSLSLGTAIVRILFRFLRTIARHPLPLSLPRDLAQPPMTCRPPK